MQEATGKIKYIAPIDMNEFSITNVSAIRQAAGKWSLDEHGLLVIDEVRAQKLCLDDLCITRSELENILTETNTSAAGENDVPGATNNEETNTSEATATTQTETTTATSTTDTTATSSDEDTPPQDNTAPVISLSGSSSIEVEEGSTYTDPGATATDDTDGDITHLIQTSGLPIDTSSPGSATITYTVTDTAGNEANTSRTIIITELIEVITTVRTTDETASSSPLASE
jgi:hypothetical protein